MSLFCATAEFEVHITVYGIVFYQFL